MLKMMVIGQYVDGSCDNDDVNDDSDDDDGEICDDHYNNDNVDNKINERS